MQLPDELKVAIDTNAYCAIATHLNENVIQNHLMWIDYEDESLIINTEKGRQKTLNIRNNRNISLVIFKPDAMYISWEIRGVVEEVVDDESANKQIDEVSKRYTGHLYARDNNTSWKDAKIKDREMWRIKIEKLVAMNRPAANIVQPVAE
jgi:general stress protein 26